LDLVCKVLFAQIKGSTPANYNDAIMEAIQRAGAHVAGWDGLEGTMDLYQFGVKTSNTFILVEQSVWQVGPNVERKLLLHSGFA
jgi:hypothetical protein